MEISKENKTKAVVSRCGDWDSCIAYSPEDEEV